MFMLAYTFTQTVGDIEQAASDNWPAAVGGGTAPYSGLFQWTNSATYPNIIQVDNVGTDGGNLPALCVAISQAYSCCDC